MLIAAAQREVRTTFRHGSVGQIVSGLIWLASATIGTWGQVSHAIWLLVIGGAFIFPITQLALRILGGPYKLDKQNPLGRLAMQIAFTVPIALPVVGGAALHKLGWFYPGAMIVVGAHYLPFVFLYGMWQFAVLAAVLVSAGLAFAMYWSSAIVPPGFFAGAVLVAFGLWFAVIHKYVPSRDTDV